MDYLLQALRIDAFEPLLRAYRDAGTSLGDALDGGAGAGTTAAVMLKYMDADAVVHAYEPFPGNHPFFEDRDPRIQLERKALAGTQGVGRLSVPSVVAADSEWGRRGMIGYSSAGHLDDDAPPSPHDALVECVRADEDLAGARRIGFVKLDLQGGELNALRGMSGFLRRDVALAWVEYHPGLSRPELYHYLSDQGFLVFDTEYIFRGEPTEDAMMMFDVSRKGAMLSSGSMVWYGFKRTPWNDYAAELIEFVRNLRLIQTDLCCVNGDYLPAFLSALHFLK